MKQPMALLLFLTAAFFFACAAFPSIQERRFAAAKSIAALQDAEFETAMSEADTVLTEDPKNPFSALVRAVTTYKSTLHDLFLDVQSTVLTAAFGRGFNEKYLKYALENADKAFQRIDQDLAVAADKPDVDLEICLACWEYDWNRDGHVDERDQHLLEIEQDVEGNPISEDDPRRKPTFRFDYGDVLWARAFIAFHRAAVSLAMAFDFSRIFEDVVNGKPDVLTIPLVSKEKIAEAKQFILSGLDYSDQSREAYLAETDDDREWLPNPRQKNHPLPMPVDDALYDTWRHTVSDVRKIVNGEQGLSLAELAQLGDHQWDNPPKGYLNVGKMFTEPTTIVLEIDAVEDIDDNGNADEALRRVLGKYYAENMAHSMLIRRLERMKSEVDRGQESVERKLRYLLWLN